MELPPNKTLFKNLNSEIEKMLKSRKYNYKKIHEKIAYQKGDFKAKDNLLKESEELLAEANKLLFGLVKREVKGEKIPFSILLIHACDILMSSVTARELVAKLTEKGSTSNIDQSNK